ncbi:MAG: GNAT family N-acetyltransferase [Anaerolineales bacterium]|nr:GNAT family N-acetyltransferase [Anaerolineales bacterium]
MPNLQERDSIVHLLSPTSPEDALTAYYALYHKRSQLFTCGQEVVVGFLAVCQTAHDLFTPLVVMRADSDDVLSALLSDHLDEGREYLFAAKEQRASVLRRCLITWDECYNLIYTVDRASFRPDSRRLVETVVREGRVPRFEVRDGEKVIAVAGTNWRSPYFAEVGVYTQEGYRERGLARAVVSACTSELLEEGVKPLYIVTEGNAASIRICEALGYRFSGYREFSFSGFCINTKTRL